MITLKRKPGCTNTFILNIDSSLVVRELNASQLTDLFNQAKDCYEGIEYQWRPCGPSRHDLKPVEPAAPAVNGLPTNG